MPALTLLSFLPPDLWPRLNSSKVRRNKASSKYIYLNLLGHKAERGEEEASIYRETKEDPAHGHVQPYSKLVGIY